MAKPHLSRQILEDYGVQINEIRGEDNDNMPKHVQNVMDGLLDFQGIIPKDKEEVSALLRHGMSGQA
jgi:hypothetical protein